MGGLIGILSTIVGFVPAVAGKVMDYFSVKGERRKELAAMEHERKMAVEQRLKELALDKSKSDSLWALEQLKHSDKYMRWALFIIVWLPLIAGAFFPVEVKAYFENILSVVPEWWIGMAVGITTAVFGIREILRFKSK